VDTPLTAPPRRSRRPTDEGTTAVERRTPTASRHRPELRLRIELEDRCRALARVIALIEGRGMEIGELRFWPASTHHAGAEAIIEVAAPGPQGEARMATLIARIEALPSVRRARVELPALTA